MYLLIHYTYTLNILRECNILNGMIHQPYSGARPLRVIIAGGGPGGLALARGLVELPGRATEVPVEA